MKIKTIIIASALILIGTVLFVSVWASAGFDFTNLSDDIYETHIYDITENFTNLKIDVDTSDVKLVHSTDGSCKIEFFEKINLPHTFSVKNGSLIIENSDSRKWYEFFEFNFQRPEIIVYLPDTSYSDISIHTVTGDTEIDGGFVFESLNIDTTTGDVEFTEAEIGTLDISVTTGYIRVKHTSVVNEATISITTGDVYLTHFTGGKLTAKGTTSDIKLDYCDADEIHIKTTTGDVNCALLSSKLFVANTTTGKINVPKTQSGGICEVNTTTGNIKISIVR